MTTYEDIILAAVICTGVVCGIRVIARAAKEADDCYRAITELSVVLNVQRGRDDMRQFTTWIVERVRTLMDAVGDDR